MHSVGLIVGIAALTILGVLCALVIIDNTRVLNEEKALRALLNDIQREAETIGPNPTDAQVAALNARIDDYQQRFATWRRSPFVITRS